MPAEMPGLFFYVQTAILMNKYFSAVEKKKLSRLSLLVAVRCPQDSSFELNNCWDVDFGRLEEIPP